MPASGEDEAPEEETTDRNGNSQPNRNTSHHHRRWAMVVQTLTLVTVLFLSVYNHALLSSSSEESSATPWLVESEPFNELAPCSEGGVRLHTGFDLNENGVLDVGERQDTAVLCQGLRGLSGPQGQPGVSGVDATPQRLSMEVVPLGNETCQQGGVIMASGLDLNTNDVLDHEEVHSQTMLCNGALGGNGTNGLNGTDGSIGASALVDKVPAPTYLCADGFVVRFGVDDGLSDGTANNGQLDEEEIRETLNFCFAPLRSERVTDVFAGTGNSMTTGCDSAAWMERTDRFVFAANDGVNGCELHAHHPESNTTTMVLDLHATGDASPGREVGILPVEDGRRVLFDADDGINGRQLWVSDGTSNGTESLGSVEMTPPLAWAEGFLFRSTSNQLLWTNGSDLRDWLALPSWNTTQQQEAEASLSGLSNLGQAWMHTDDQAVWFSASDGGGDVEPYRLSRHGELTSWNINEFGSAQLENLLSIETDVIAAASRGGVKQALRLFDNGSHDWLTSISPASGDTHLGEGMGLHLIGENLVYDAMTVQGEPRLWTTNLGNGITLQLSSNLLAPGAQIGVANTGSRLLFDCMSSTTGLETCITDGTPQGSRVLADMTPGMMSSDVRAIVAVGEGWLVVGDGTVAGASVGVSLWAVEGEAVRLVYNPWEGGSNSSEALNYGQVVLSPTQAWFVAHDGVHGHEWHRWSHGELSDDWIVIHR